jgi:hypothetical protein
MYLLYLDDAGSVQNQSDRHFILAGIALFERQVHFLNEELEALAKEVSEHAPHDVELHANPIHSGRGMWRKQPKQLRRQLIARGLAVADKLHGKWALFGAVIEKVALPGEDAAEYAFEQLVSRFDMFLSRMYQKNNTQRGLMILDKTVLETRLQTITREFKRDGHRWGRLRNFVDVPFFVDSRATRAVQYADLVAYALWRKYEKADDEFFKIIETAFDAEGGVRHGLVVKSNQIKEQHP